MQGAARARMCSAKRQGLVLTNAFAAGNVCVCLSLIIIQHYACHVRRMYNVVVPPPCFLLLPASRCSPSSLRYFTRNTFLFLLISASRVFNFLITSISRAIHKFKGISSPCANAIARAKRFCEREGEGEREKTARSAWRILRFRGRKRLSPPGNDELP